jgi:hypothetical protein
MFAPHLTGLAKRTMRKRGEESGMWRLFQFSFMTKILSHTSSRFPFCSLTFNSFHPILHVWLRLGPCYQTSSCSGTPLSVAQSPGFAFISHTIPFFWRSKIQLLHIILHIPNFFLLNPFTSQAGSSCLGGNK